ncbi:MAG: type IX secretion system protein PorQ, partial [Flavobacteriaceae bacterium]
FLVCFSSIIYAQIGGEQIYNFLNVPTSARQAALGGKTLTILDDVNQGAWNPAMINQEMDNHLSVNYVNFLADINYGSVNFAHLVSKRFGTIHSGVTFVDYGKLIGADENGTETGTFHARDIALSVGYAYQIPWSSFYIGSNLKLINATIANYNSFGIATDIGISYYNEKKPFVITAVLRNLGYQITAFDDNKEKLPFQIELGATYQLEKIPLKWYLTIDHLQKWNVSVINPSNSETSIDGTTSTEKIGFLDNLTRHTIVGAEFFSEKIINFRLGYNFRRAKELNLTEIRTFAGFSAGFGIRLRKMKFNYAYTKYHPASNTSTFSLRFDLN